MSYFKYPDGKWQRGRIVATIACAVIFIAAMLGDDPLPGPVESAPPGPPTQAEIDAATAPPETSKEENRRTGMVILVARKLRDAMKDPSSLEFSQVIFYKESGDICYVYRGKNSFNATVPGRAVFTENPMEIVTESDGDKFTRTWNKTCTRPGKDMTAVANTMM